MHLKKRHLNLTYILKHLLLTDQRSWLFHCSFIVKCPHSYYIVCPSLNLLKVLIEFVSYLHVVLSMSTHRLELLRFLAIY